MKIFVLMPFQDEFDDVHHIIKDAANQVSGAKSSPIECFRADEIAAPGRISDQILEAIQNADLVIADLTGNNPNVMYELGYAHALKKPAVILNQTIEESPFDVKDFRQITYDRTRLLKDCRPAIIASISAVMSGLGVDDSSIANDDGDAEIQDSSQERISRDDDFIIPGDELTAALQTSYLKIKLLRTQQKQNELIAEGENVRQMLDRITVVGQKNRNHLENAMGIAGNCATQLELSKHFSLAETIYRKAIGLFSEHAGLHIQYSDFLVDRGQHQEAEKEFSRAMELDPTDERIRSLQTKIAIATGKISNEFGSAAQQAFENDPSDGRCAASYLMYLTETNASVEEFEAVCKKWADASEDSYAARRALADFLAHRDESRADEMYTEMLGELLGDKRHDVLHNLATLKASRGDDASAREYWSEAYRIDPADSTVRASFSQFLARNEETELALKVASGETIDESDLA